MLEQIVMYLRDRANADDIDVLSFSLHHMFYRVDYLYRTVLPELMAVSPSPVSNTAASHRDELLRHQHIWTKLRTVEHTLNRLAPLCSLLGDATACTLDVLDMTTGASPAHQQSTAIPEDELYTHDASGDEQALTATIESLSCWQANYNALTLVVDHFAHLAPAIPTLILLDETFTIILDCASAIFGDILPGFQALATGDDDAVATLLFDLMHQADQLLTQCDVALEPLHALIAQFALPVNR